MSNGKVIIIHFRAAYNRHCIKWLIFLKYGPFGDINVKVDLSNFVTKADLKNATGIGTSRLALKSNLATLKAEIDKIDVEKLKTVSIDLSKLSNVIINNNVVKKTVYDKLVEKVNNMDTSGSVLKTKHDTEKLDLEKKINDADKIIPDTSGLV